jgi:hypothetical protein
VIAGIYPVRDVIAEGLGLVPGSLRGPVRDATMAARLRPLAQVGQIVAGLTVSLDPTIATGFALTQAGERVGEPRGGLADDWYRRIVLGRMSAMSGGGLLPGVVATWLALAGAPQAGRWQVRRLPSPGRPAVGCFALTDTLPDAVWLARASAVLRDSVAAGVEIYGVLYLDDALTLAPGGGYGFGAGTLSALVQ